MIDESEKKVNVSITIHHIKFSLEIPLKYESRIRKAAEKVNKDILKMVADQKDQDIKKIYLTLLLNREAQNLIYLEELEEAYRKENSLKEELDDYLKDKDSR